MTPLSLARKECANYADGTCMCFDLRNGVITKWGKDQDCVMHSNHRCEYFERLVLPMVNLTTDHSKQRELQEANEIYNQSNFTESVSSAMFADENMSPTLCPDCGDHKPKGSSRCGKCATKRKRQKNRERLERHRHQNKV